MNGHLVLGKTQRLPGGNGYLLTDDINAGYPFGYRMLNLNTGIHFDKIKFSVLVQKFKSTCAAIAQLSNRPAHIYHQFPRAAAHVMPGAGASSRTF